MAVGAALFTGLISSLEAQSNYATPYAFKLFAGGVDAGSADGAGSAAQFNHPYGIAIDSTGTLYIADTANDTIRVISKTGDVTTLAGSAGAPGSTDGTGIAARFNGPTGIAVGAGGDLFVADSNNNSVRKITSGGVVTTLAGLAGTAGGTDGTGSAALFGVPQGVAVDGNGNIYVADTSNNTIRKVTQAGVVTTLAGTLGEKGSVDGTTSSARFNMPIGIAVDSTGNVYVGDTNNNTIREVTAAGVVTTLAGSPGVTGTADGSAAGARFKSPRGLVVDGSGNIFIADAENSTIRKLSGGVVTTLAGSAGNFADIPGTGAAALLDVPVGVAVDSSGDLYVTQQIGSAISVGTAVTTVAVSVTHQPSNQTISEGSTVVFTGVASGTPAPSYQWFFNGSALADGSGVSGASGPTLVLSGASAVKAGAYSFAATNSEGTVQSDPATLTVSATSDIGHLINVSCRSEVGTGANILITGFALGGSGTTGAKSVLIRASGPALTAFSVAGALPDPDLGLFTGSTSLGANSSWGGSAQIADAAAEVGAFAWTNPASHDAALLETLPVGAYTAEVSGMSADSGVALAEIYDASPAGTFQPSSPRLVNVSARTQVGTGANVLIAGFVIGGSTSRTVLIRASGPALIPFGLTATLPDPQLGLYSGSTQIGGNTGWGGGSVISGAASAVGAFAWTDPTSDDSAILVTLPPGSYTAQVSGASGDTGIALVEVYDVP